MQPGLECAQYKYVATMIEKSGVYNRHFWKVLSDLVDDKIRTVKYLEPGHTIDLSYYIEMLEQKK